MIRLRVVTFAEADQQHLAQATLCVLIHDVRVGLEEIGRRMGSNRNAIYKLTHGARKRLRKALESAGYEAADVGSAFGD